MIIVWMFYETMSTLLIDNDRLSGKRGNIDKSAFEMKEKKTAVRIAAKISQCIEILLQWERNVQMHKAAEKKTEWKRTQRKRDAKIALNVLLSILFNCSNFSK